MSNTTNSPQTDQAQEDTEDSIHREILAGYLDDHDYDIFQKLNADGRVSDTELAEEVGLSRSAVRRRRENLLERGTVDIHAVLVLQELDLAYADVLVTLDQDITADQRSQFISGLIDQELIYSLDSCLGSYDLFVRLWHKSLNDLKEYTWEILEDEPAVDSFEIIPMVHTWKAWNKELDRPEIS